MVRPRLIALVAVAAAVIVAHSADAQPPMPGPPPKAFNPKRIGPADLRSLGPGQPKEVPDYRLWLQRQNMKALPKGFDAELYKKLMKELPEGEMPDQQQFKEMFEKNPQLKDPAFLKQLEQMLQSDEFPNNLEGKLKNPDGSFPMDVPKIEGQNPDQLKSKLEQAVESGKMATVPEGGPKGDPKLPPDIDPSKAPPKIDPKTASQAGENEWVKWIEKHFSNSPAGQAAIKDLMSALEKQDMKGMFDQVPEFKNGGWKEFDSWGKANAGGLWNMKPPDLSGNKVTPPKIGGGSGGGSPSGGGGGFGGGGTGIGGGGSALAVIAGIAGAILLAFLLFRKWKLNHDQRAAAAAARAGIDFDAIRTREELVRAFDHVSLDQIGAEARPWNHRVIADQIAEARPAQAEPADELAGLYERARYAPADEDLTAGEFSSARRDLRVIAGVPA